MEHVSKKSLAISLATMAYTAETEQPKGFYHCGHAKLLMEFDNSEFWTFTYYYDGEKHDPFWHSWMSDIRFPSKREAEEAMAKFVWELNTR